MAGSVRFNLPFTLGIGDTVPSNVPPEARPAFIEVYSAFQQVQSVFHNYLGIGQQLKASWPDIPMGELLHRFSPWRLYVKASEAIGFGNAINLHAVSGVINVRKANATNNTKPCHGFCTVTVGIPSGEYGEVILCQGITNGITGLTVGTRYFLSTTDGLLTSVAPVAAGNIEQAVGIALESALFLFNFDFEYIPH